MFPPDYVIIVRFNSRCRSPSPEPIYNNEGKRLNTREYRTRKKLEELRHELVTKASGTNPEYKPPADYKPPVVRVSDKVMIPQEKHPDINFVGLLIGPRGNTLKNLEKDTGAKIIIRGKGSVKEGKIGRKDGQPLPGEDEPLHAYITANNPENVKKAAEKIQEIILQGIEVPEGQNDLRRQQLRELALLNGTLRENDGLAKLKQLQQAQTIVTNTIVCTICGGTGHIAQDCKGKRPGDTFKGMTTTITPTVDRAKMDSEYSALMAELGEGPPPMAAAPPPSAMTPSRPSLMSQPPPLTGSRPPFNASQPPPPLLGNSTPTRPPPTFQTSQPTAYPVHSKPPSLMSIPTTPISQSGLATSMQAPPPQLGAPPQNPPPQLGAPPPQLGAPPPQMGAPPPVVSSHLGAPPQMGVPPPVATSQAPSIAPWQQSSMPVSSQSEPPRSSYGSTPSLGMPPQNILSAPPPPPPPSSQSGYPWQQQQPPPQPVGYGAPASSAPGLPPWQQPPQQAQPPPSSMGPPVSQALPPWQQTQPVPPPPGMPQLHSAVPPPPPPSQQVRPPFNPVAPPPPPPGGTLTSLAGSIPLGVPPPPPPN